MPVISRLSHWIRQLRTPTKSRRSSRRSRPGECLESRALLATVQLDFSSAFNRDGMRNRTGGADDNTDQSIDAGNSRLVTQSYATNQSANGNGLPDNGFFAADTNHPSVQLGYRNSDNGNNLVFLDAVDESVTVNTLRAGYDSLHVFALSTNGTSQLNVTLNYVDGSVTKSTTVQNWFDEVADGTTTGDAVQYELIDGMDRHDQAFDNVNDPAIFGMKFSVDPARILTSVTLQQKSARRLSVFGATGNVASFVVDSLEGGSDGNYASGDFSLREAIEFANASAEGSTDSIRFANGLTGTITVASELQITDSVMINGPGADKLAISANHGAHRVVKVDNGAASLIDVSISGLTIRDGGDGVASVSGAGIQSAENLTLSAVSITGNNTSSGSGGGGGIQATAGNLVLQNSLVAGNLANQGGGIELFGNSAIIINSTVSDNSAALDGGGIVVVEGNIVIRNSTITGNRSDSNNSGGESGGGVFGNAGLLTLHNSIVAGNFRGTGTTPNDAVGLVATSSFNLIGDAGTAGGLTNGTNGNIVGVNGVGTRAIATILSATLANNGGSTQTHALVAGSAALNAGSNAQALNASGGALTTDQRGAARISGSAVDIGAVELSPTTLTVDITADEDDGNRSAGDLSLREAIAISNISAEVMTINFASSLLNPTAVTTLPLTLGELFVTSDVSISGPGANLMTVDAQGNSRVFRVGTGSSVSISGLTIKGGDATKSTDNDPSFSGLGGGILNEGGTLTLDSVRVSGNSATYGAGVINYGRSAVASLSVRNSTIDANTATDEGGGLYNWGDEGVAIATVMNSTISGNSATKLGGGIAQWDGGEQTAISLLNSTIVSNTAGIVGGGIYLYNFGLFMANSIVAGNSAGDVTGSVPDNRSFNNIIGSPSSAGGLVHGTNGNIVGNGSGGNLPLSQILNTTLANNGGPTPTHALAVGSPAIERGVSIPDLLIKPTGVTSSRAATDFRPASNLLNSTALTLQNYATTNDFDFDRWVTNDPNGGTGSDFFANATPAPVLTFTLDALYLLTDVALWGYSRSDNNDAKTVKLEFSTNGGSTYTSSLTLHKPRISSTEFVHTLPFGTAIAANYVRMTILDNWFGEPGSNGGDRVGLDEVRFLLRGLSPAADQRGGNFGRSLDGDHVGVATPDIGAFESPGVRVITPNPNTFSLRPTFTWTPIAGATSYNIQINNDSTGQAQFHLGSSNTASYTPNTDLAIGKFRMWVRPVFGSTLGNWSAPHLFNNLTLATWTTMPRVQLTSRPTLTWNAQPGATSYELWVNNHSTGQQEIIRQVVTGTSFTPATDLPIGNYRAWVRGRAADGSFGGWSVLYDALVVPGPTPIGPLNATFDRTPTFSWSTVTGAVGYELYVRNLSTNTMTINGQSVTGTSFTPTSNLSDGPYRWWAFAVGSIATNGMKSGGAIVTDIFVGGRPTFTAPMSGSSSSDRTPTFSWRAVDDAASYSLQVDRTDVAQPRVINLSGLTGTSFAPTANLAAGTYRAWVRAVSATGQLSLWSIEVNFTLI